ncbi:hypothetical protein [uncultured Vibrio sp.]|uniref:hypothetical protein n=1 Tax=uncultured Vibrio sp. TaxID=114054 RepID=UPI002612C928|nr:hypothetical protein [uncultured Vibrio sp.]
MLSKTKVRIASFLSIFIVIAWWYPTLGVYRDYLALINNYPKVQLSVLTLWVPVGGLGAIILLVVFSCIAFYTGKPARSVIGERWTPWVNKICIYSALSGVAFAVGWTYHSIDLLENNGYVYSRDLTKITPTGIHLMYVKAR